MKDGFKGASRSIDSHSWACICSVFGGKNSNETLMGAGVVDTGESGAADVTETPFWVDWKRNKTCAGPLVQRPWIEAAGVGRGFRVNPSAVPF